ncbi:hypothetical protein DICVIV_02088 [Dictyocaulus viviparus]|uniref:Uncharacterized protein n=1 Tax=Dictyocaulus viviparus TaxID=29172 RepID=A0A0D8YB51_DICVI|nr:hypothetical protein DICVIV_02088 [Dictyocaulus viviparus]
MLRFIVIFLLVSFVVASKTSSEEEDDDGIPCSRFDETSFIPGKHVGCVAFQVPYTKSDYCSVYANRFQGYSISLWNTSQCITFGTTIICTCSGDCTPDDLPEPYSSLIGKNCSEKSYAIHPNRLLNEMKLFTNTIPTGPYNSMFFNTLEQRTINAIYSSKKQLEIYGVSPYTLAFVQVIWAFLCGVIFFKTLYLTSIVIMSRQLSSDDNFYY